MIKRITGVLRAASLFERFEQIAMMILTFAIFVLTCLGLFHVLVAVAMVVLTTGLEPTSQPVLQAIFGLFFTVLIALEFRHSILITSDAQPQSVIRMRSVLLIGMMATVRRFIVMDLGNSNVLETLALSASVLALGVAYWLVRGTVSAPSIERHE